jgi:hypothetical protein
MLVPAMAFAWWLVPLATPAPAMQADSGLRPKDAAIRSDPTGSVERGQKTSGYDDRYLFRGVLTPEMIRTAQTFLDLPMRAQRVVVLDGHEYVFVLERHYHPPGFAGAPTGWHKGVTVYQLP